VFVRSSGLALVSFGLAPRTLLRALEASESARRGKTLVVVFQRGACDGLNTVVPYGEEEYRRARRSIAIPAPRGNSRDAALDLDGFFGLHPALEPLMPLWKDGSLAAVHAVGSPAATRSHFDAQDFMESGTPDVKSTEDGWMNRCLHARPDPAAGPFRAVALTPTLPRSLSGREPAVALGDMRAFGLRRSAPPQVARGFEDMYAGAVQETMRGTGSDAFEALAFLKQADPARYKPAPGAEYPRGRFGESLKQVAQLVKADVGVELAFAEIGGWDHHALEGGVEGQLANRLRELGETLAAFHRDLGPRVEDVVLVTLTEFGRTVRENGNRGTDHGHAGVSFVLGGPVRGGKVHGRWPGLKDDQLYESRDLALTTDFRDLLGELLSGHLGVTKLEAVFPGRGPSTSGVPGVIRT
jgi:uncharacterized protein (DUF1501 family)